MNLRGSGAGVITVEHPGNAETVGEHAEAFRPEGFAEGHVHGAVFGEGVEDALGFGDGVDAGGTCPAAGVPS